jgi:hypothetical protein
MGNSLKILSWKEEFEVQTSVNNSQRFMQVLDGFDMQYYFTENRFYIRTTLKNASLLYELIHKFKT